MASLRAITLAITAGLAGSVAMATLAAGCSGDDNGGTPIEGGADQTAEGATSSSGSGSGSGSSSGAKKDGGTESSAESGSGSSSGTASSSGASSGSGSGSSSGAKEGGEAGSSSGASSSSGSGSGSSSGSDGGSSSGSKMDGGDASDTGQPSDAGDASDGPFIPPGLLMYQQQYAQAFCQATLHCCDNFDAGAYDLNACQAANQTVGWENTLPPQNSIFTRGNLAFDQEAGAGCLAALGTVPCTALTATENSSIINACASVIHGTIPVGSFGCGSSWECAPGAFCDSTMDGGLCTALVAQGAACGNKAPNDEMCAYLSTHTPSLYCDFINHPDGGGATCVPTQADPAGCVDPNGFSYDFSCTSELCGDNNTCGSSQTNFNTGTTGQCATYLITDAGGG